MHMCASGGDDDRGFRRVAVCRNAPRIVRILEAFSRLFKTPALCRHMCVCVCVWLSWTGLFEAFSIERACFQTAQAELGPDITLADLCWCSRAWL